MNTPERLPIQESAPPDGLTDYQRGALAFKALLVQLVGVNKQSLETYSELNLYAFAPVLHAGCAKPMSDGMAAGFWESFAVWMQTELDASELAPDGWDPLENIALFPREDFQP